MNIAETVIKIAEDNPNNKGKIFKWEKKDDCYVVKAYRMTTLHGKPHKIAECTWDSKTVEKYLVGKKYDVEGFGFGSIEFAKQVVAVQNIKKKIMGIKGCRNLRIFTLGKYISIRFIHPLDWSEYHSIFSVDAGKSFWFSYCNKNVGRVIFRTYADMIEQLKNIDKNVRPRIDHS